MIASDREMIAWVASTGGVTGQMVRDLMLTCVEARFGSLEARSAACARPIPCSGWPITALLTRPPRRCPSRRP